MGFNDVVREKIRNFLRIEDPSGLSIKINRTFDFEAETFRNKLWYRGEANELEEFYTQLARHNNSRHFWGSRPSKGSSIRKIHTGLPALIVDKLTNICTDALLSIELSDRKEEWTDIAKENSFKYLLSEAVSDVLIQGDGAFKLSYDSKISELPIIEFFPAERVDFERERGRLKAVIFKTEKVFRKKKYILKERYGRDGITYSLYAEDDPENPVDMNSFPELAELKPVVNYSDFIPAVPLMFFSSKKDKGRGKSIFGGKYDAFDSFDEVVSQWMLAVRKGQIKTYIPESLLPRDADTGEIRGYNDFDSDFISMSENMTEGASNKIETTQGTIQYEALLATYCTALDLCLQGIISPSTLGIDVKKLDNAEAQREKEKTTLYTRADIINPLQEALKDLITTSLKFKDAIEQKPSGNIDVTVTFSEYANPSFEAQVETIGKAVGYGIMSTEAGVDELYGDDKDEDWKQKEIKRIKAERGIIEEEEPAVSQDTIIGFRDDE